MRDIKFRAWEYGHERTNGIGWASTPVIWKMDYEPEVYGSETASEGDSVTLNKALNNGGDADYQMAMKSTFMQYTGLKDKNGVEIYEGDILQWSYRKKDELCIVSYQDQWGSFVIDSKRAGRRKITHVISSLPEYGSVVVGNIYENPELLKEAK